MKNPGDSPYTPESVSDGPCAEGTVGIGRFFLLTTGSGRPVATVAAAGAGEGTGMGRLFLTGVMLLERSLRMP